MEKVFITGVYISGTTLLEKLLHNHPQGLVASQPFPMLYIFAKRIYNDLNGLPNTPYPINDALFDRSFSAKDFHDFLTSHTFSQGDIQGFFDKMQHYSGCKTPAVKAHADKFKPTSFFGIFERLYDLIPKIIPKKDLLFVGSKEIVCEDYIPFLLSKGCKVLQIIRDPRNIIASANYNHLNSHVGAPRPLEFTIRMWRKSVASVIENERDMNFYWLRYEDLINKPDGTFSEIAGFLKVDSFEKNIMSRAVYDQQGNLWKGNSSFKSDERTERKGMGRYEELLDEKEIEYIERFSFPEMLLMGYQPTNDLNKVSTHPLMSSTKKHPAFEKTYYNNVNVLREEEHRLSLLTAKRSSASEKNEMNKLFYSATVYNKLRSALGYDE